MIELDIQAKMVDSCITQGGFGFKMSNRFLAGIPDLFLSMPETGPAVVEIKLIEGKSRIIAPTPLQVDRLIKLHLAGTVTGLAGVEFVRNGVYNIFVTHDPNKTRVDESFMHLTKIIGREWPIRDMILHLKRFAQPRYPYQKVGT